MKKNILIVDDSKDSLNLIRHFLKDFKDCRMIEARSGAAALEMMEKVTPDLILLDIVMPEMDGLECCRLIKEKPTFWDTPIIMVTAMKKGEGLQKAFEVGATDYIRKPIEKIEIEARVRSALNLNSAITKLKASTSDLMQTAQSLESANQKLKQLSFLDGLTNISNRRYFDQIIDKEWRRARREKHSLSLIMADIDSFKLFNDHYGHQAGDECLKQVAKTLEALVSRPGDLVARYDGEEFVTVLSDTHIDGAVGLATKMLQGVKDLKVKHAPSAKCAVVSISLGVSSVIPSENSSFKKLIKAADDELFRAKKNGGNRVITANKINN